MSEGLAVALISNIRPTQPETPWLQNCQQVVDATHENWDLHFTIIGRELARYTLQSCTPHSALLCTLSHAKWRRPFWLWSLIPRKQDPCEHMWVLIGQHVHTMQMTMKLRIYSAYCSTACSSTYVLPCYWSAPLLSLHSFTGSPSLSYHALFDMHSELLHFFSHVLELLFQQGANCSLMYVCPMPFCITMMM